MKHSFEELLVMVISTFVNLQGFVVDKEFIIKEVAVLKQGTVLSHITFLRVPCHGNFWQDPTGLVLPGWMLIIMDCDGKTGWSRTGPRGQTPDHGSCFEDDAIVYVKGREKRTAMELASRRARTHERWARTHVPYWIIII